MTVIAAAPIISINPKIVMTISFLVLVNKTADKASRMKKAVIVLLIGEIGYWAYSAAPQAAYVKAAKAKKKPETICLYETACKSAHFSSLFFSFKINFEVFI